MHATELDRDAPAESEQAGRNRRVWPRVSATALQHVKARLATGGEIVLKDLSRTGARLESARRMLPNSSISLTLVTPDTNVVMTGLIVRSRIVRLAGGLGYDVAVSFNELLHQLPEIPEPAVPDLPGVPVLPALPRLPDAPDVAMLRVTADMENSESLRDLLDENGW
jgi:hypothetical protein